jgi:hypothetical protein
MRNRASREDLPELVCPARPCLADDPDRLRHEEALPRPLEQEVRNGLVEHLVRRGQGPRHVVVDPPHSHQPANRLRSGLVSPDIRRNQERTLRMWVKPTNVIEQLFTGLVPQRLPGKHECNLRAGIAQLLQPRQRLIRIPQSLNAVLTAITLDELTLELRDGSWILVDGEQNRKSHRPSIPAARHTKTHDVKAGPAESRGGESATRVSSASGARPSAHPASIRGTPGAAWMTMSPGPYSANVARRTSLRSRRSAVPENRGKVASTFAQSAGVA